MAHNNNRARSVANHLLAHRTQKEASEPATAMASNYDQGCASRFFQQDIGRWTLKQLPLAWYRWMESRCPGKRLVHYGLGFCREGL